ncbi:hypothetical protein QVD17_17504 [Tagetes erecta]|uniref:Uncharacterized protein n=1 Tax=Tagetes erecta TaxID=13708 RepID=A0AAD8KZL6_TARER|nr:hypothetical protein QVD17_17504 [Tagetes erecta]
MCGAWGLLDGQLSRSDVMFRCDVTQAPRIGLCAAPGGILCFFQFRHHTKKNYSKPDIQRVWYISFFF